MTATVGVPQSPFPQDANTGTPAAVVATVKVVVVLLATSHGPFDTYAQGDTG